jgi:hypothetical protein
MLAAVPRCSLASLLQGRNGSGDLAKGRICSLRCESLSGFESEVGQDHIGPRAAEGE